MNLDDFKMICEMIFYGALAAIAVLAVFLFLAFIIKFILDDLW